MPVVRPSPAGEFPRLQDGFHEVALGNGSQCNIALLRDGPVTELMIGVIGGQCYIFDHAYEPAYFEEKLRLCKGDAENMADFAACQLGMFDPSRHGVAAGHHYNPRLCRCE